MKTSTWKSVERAIAKVLRDSWEVANPDYSGPKIDRVPITGRGRGSAPDIYHPMFSIEVKHRKSLPKWLKEEFEMGSNGSIWATGRGRWRAKLKDLVMYFNTVKDIQHFNFAEEQVYGGNDPEPYVPHKQLPAEFIDAFVQAAASTEGDPTKVGLVILHEKAMKYEDSLVFVVMPEQLHEMYNVWINGETETPRPTT
jgi:hypothetical protein